MTRPRSRDIGGIPLLEQSILLLRSTPLDDWAVYLLGVIPFIAAFLYYSTDSLRNFFAREHLFASSLAITALFLWKQLMESLFLSRLHGTLNGSDRRTNISALASTLVRQAAVQPTSFLTLPFALSAGIPVPWTVFFYRNFSLLALEDPAQALSRSWRLARLFQGQAWVFLGMLSLVALLLYVNLLVAVLVAAQLSRSFFGVEELLADPRSLVASGTIHLGILLIVYSCCDALLNAATALRCFYGDSIQSGADILAGLRRLTAVAALLVVCFPAHAQVDRKSLDDSIDRTLQQREFTWRMPPRDEEAPPLVNWFVKALEWSYDLLDKVFSAIREWLKPRDKGAGVDSGSGMPSSVRYLLIALAVLATAAIVVVYVRAMRARTTNIEPSSAATVRSIDVKDESVLADQLSEDSWLEMADGLMAKGEYRLALRAMHLAGLRLLAERRLVTIQRWKSGLEYHAEIRRRARQAPQLGEAFARNLRLFDLGWYSFHPVEPPMLDDYRHRLKEIRAYAAQ